MHERGEIEGRAAGEYTHFEAKRGEVIHLIFVFCCIGKQSVYHAIQVGRHECVPYNPPPNNHIQTARLIRLPLQVRVLFVVETISPVEACAHDSRGWAVSDRCRVQPGLPEYVNSHFSEMIN
jgi:hypothetical protein